MKILVIGGGGREHAIAWKIAQSHKVEKLYCAPGNGGIAGVAECVPIKADALDELLSFAKEKAIDLTVVGPEVPLTMGIVDLFEKEGLKVFGPSGDAAQLEGSKAFAKELMEENNVPTAGFKAFTDFEEAKGYIESQDTPIVVKADGLAAGKGVIICKTTDEAVQAAREMLIDKKFGAAGEKIVVEDCLTGEEASIFAIVDGKDYILFPSSQDHKRAFDNDEGLNTGGMGAYAPAPIATDVLIEKTRKEVIEPVIEAFIKRGTPYKGVLYAGLMIKEGLPQILEFNCRFGDPETQAILPLIDSDFVDILMASAEGNIKDVECRFKDSSCINVVMASGGYPGSYEKGKKISGLDTFSHDNEHIVFHAGTKSEGGEIYSAGGRVLNVTVVADTLKQTIDEVYNVITGINFDKAFFRSDIGRKGL